MLRKCITALLASVLALPSLLPLAAAAMTVDSSTSVTTETTVTNENDQTDVETTTEVKTTEDGKETTKTTVVKKGPCADKTGDAKLECLRNNRGQMIKKTCEHKTGQDRSDCVRTVGGRTAVRAIVKVKKDVRAKITGLCTQFDKGTDDYKKCIQDQRVNVTKELKEETPKLFKKLQKANRMTKEVKKTCEEFTRGTDEYRTCHRKAMLDLSTLRTHDLKGRLSRRTVESGAKATLEELKMCRELPTKEEMRACLQKIKTKLTGSTEVEVNVITETE